MCDVLDSPDTPHRKRTEIEVSVCMDEKSSETCDDEEDDDDDKETTKQTPSESLTQ